MKKSIFKVGLLTTLILILAVSCTSSAEDTTSQLPAVSNKQRVFSNPSLPYVSDVNDIPAYIGALHNASIYAFVEYVNENGLNPYEEGGFTEAMIDTFANQYVITRLLPIRDNFSVNTYYIDYNLINLYTEEVVSFLDDYSYYFDDHVQEYTRQYCEYNLMVDNDSIVYSVIKEVAIATDRLWSCEWDFSQRCFDGSYMYFESSESEEGEEKTEEEQKELKKADIYGAAGGCIEGAKIGVKVGVATGGGAIITGVWGALIGAAVGAVSASILEYVAQEMVEVAKIIEPEDVYQNTYLYDYLLQLQNKDYAKYQELFGGKFDGYIY